MKATEKRAPAQLGGKGGPYTRSGCGTTVSQDHQPDNAHELPAGPVLDEREAAALCRVSRNTFRKYVDLGKLRPVALPLGIRRNLYRRTDVLDFLENLAVSHDDDA